MMIEQNTNYAYKLKYLGTPTFVGCYAKASKVGVAENWKMFWKITKKMNEK